MMEPLAFLLVCAIAGMVYYTIRLHQQLAQEQRRHKHEADMKQLYEQLADVRLARFNQLVRKWNHLVDQVNAAGGISALNRSTNQTVLTASDIKRMLQLCHPDRHRNSELSVQITQRLLALREQVKD
jgi:hypothetical protein